MSSRIYLFSFKCFSNEVWTINCINNRMSTLYDVKKIHDSLYLIKTTEDISLLEKYLEECFDHKDSYGLVDITDSQNRFKNAHSSNIASWIDNI